jgi:hypothetical protein
VKPTLIHDVLSEALIHAFRKHQGNCKVRSIDPEELLFEGSTQRAFKELSSENWIYGKLPKGKTCVSQYFDFGTFDVALNVEGAKMKEALVNSDCMLTDVVEKFENYLNDFTRSDLPQQSISKKYIESLTTPEEKEMAEALLTWIVPEIRKLKVI